MTHPKAIKTNGIGSKGNADHLNLTVTVKIEDKHANQYTRDK